MIRAWLAATAAVTPVVPWGSVTLSRAMLVLMMAVTATLVWRSFWAVVQPALLYVWPRLSHWMLLSETSSSVVSMLFTVAVAVPMLPAASEKRKM